MAAARAVEHLEVNRNRRDLGVRPWRAQGGRVGKGRSDPKGNIVCVGGYVCDLSRRIHIGRQCVGFRSQFGSFLLFQRLPTEEVRL
jgi:hypothetical protein